MTTNPVIKIPSRKVQAFVTDADGLIESSVSFPIRADFTVAETRQVIVQIYQGFPSVARKHPVLFIFRSGGAQ